MQPHVVMVLEAFVMVVVSMVQVVLMVKLDEH
jgi:hypothetical protein